MLVLYTERSAGLIEHAGELIGKAMQAVGGIFAGGAAPTRCAAPQQAIHAPNRCT